MTSTPNMELRLLTKTVCLSLREPLDQVLAGLEGIRFSQQNDVEMDRTYIRLLGQGVELLFQNGQLSTVFLYLTKGPDDCGSFEGTTDTIGRDVMDNPKDSVFAETLEDQGYQPAKRQYPFSVDRLNDEIRIRLEKRSGAALIMIDDGMMIR